MSLLNLAIHRRLRLTVKRTTSDHAYGCGHSALVEARVDADLVHVDVQQALADGIDAMSAVLSPTNDVEVFLASEILLDDLVGQSVGFVSISQDAEGLAAEFSPALLSNEMFNVAISQESVPEAAIPVVERSFS